MAESLESKWFAAYRQGKGYAWHLGDQWYLGRVMHTACGIDLHDPHGGPVQFSALCHNCRRVYLSRKAKVGM